MNTYPAESSLGTSPSISGFGESLSSDAVQVASTTSGFPLLNKQFTFNPKTWSFTLGNVSQTAKAAIMAFYAANESLEFYWKNEQDNITYTVCFVSPPVARLQGDDNKSLWSIRMQLLQTAP